MSGRLVQKSNYSMTALALEHVRIRFAVPVVGGASLREALSRLGLAGAVALGAAFASNAETELLNSGAVVSKLLVKLFHKITSFHLKLYIIIGAGTNDYNIMKLQVEN